MIKNWQEFYEFEDLVSRADDRLITGEGESGMHYTLMYLLRGYGVFVNSREEAIRQGKKLLKEFELANS